MERQQQQSNQQPHLQLGQPQRQQQQQLGQPQQSLMNELDAYARKQKYEPPDTSRVYNYDQLMSNHKNDRTRVNEHLLKRYTDTVAVVVVVVVLVVSVVVDLI